MVQSDYWFNFRLIRPEIMKRIFVPKQPLVTLNGIHSIPPPALSSFLHVHYTCARANGRERGSQGERALYVWTGSLDTEQRAAVALPNTCLSRNHRNYEYLAIWQPWNARREEARRFLTGKGHILRRVAIFSVSRGRRSFKIIISNLNNL